MAEELKESDGWREWSRYVLKMIEIQAQERKDLSTKIDLLAKELYQRIDAVNEKLGGRLTLLQVKVAGIGAAAAILTSIIMTMIIRALKLV